MTQRRTLLVALAVAVLFATGYSVLAPQGARGWGSIEIVDVSTVERDEGVHVFVSMRFPGVPFGILFTPVGQLTSAQCGVEAAAQMDDRRRYYGGDVVERLVLSPACPADDYELTIVLVGLGARVIARDTMRFSVP